MEINCAFQIDLLHSEVSMRKSIDYTVALIQDFDRSGLPNVESFRGLVIVDHNAMVEEPGNENR